MRIWIFQTSCQDQMYGGMMCEIADENAKAEEDKR